MLFTVFSNGNNNITITGFYRQHYTVLVKIKKFYKVLHLYSHFTYLYLLLAGNIIVYTPSSGTTREKYFIKDNIKVKTPILAGKKTTFPSISSLIGRAFSILRPKMDRPNPSEMDIKVSIPAPTYCLQFENLHFLYLGKKNTRCMTLKMKKKMKKIRKYHSRVHFINIYNSSSVFTLWN